MARPRKNPIATPVAPQKAVAVVAEAAPTDPQTDAPPPEALSAPAPAIEPVVEVPIEPPAPPPVEPPAPVQPLAEFFASIQELKHADNLVVVEAAHPDAIPGLHSGKYSGFALQRGPIFARWNDGSTL